MNSNKKKVTERGEKKFHPLLKGKIMQALYSGISNAYSEASRATQPVISTLSWMMPTNGHEEAAVKESLSNCLHEMEAVSAGKTMPSVKSILWYQNFKNIKQITLYPATQLTQLNQAQGCRIPNTQEWANWITVISNINKQLENWSIPFRFKISTEAANLDDRALKNSSFNSCLVQNIPDGSLLGTFVRHCDKVVENGKSPSGSLDGCLISIKTDMPKSVYAHELAHIVSMHPHDAMPLASLHPDVLEAMCDSVSHGDELITSLSYWNQCKDMGFPNTERHVLNSRGEWGPIDLTMAKLAVHQENNATHAQIHAEGVDKSYEWIKQNYGERAAEQFAASFAKSVFIHSMSAIVARTVTDPFSLAVSRTLIHVFANLIHLGMIGLIPTTWLNAGQFCAGYGLMGRTIKALVGVIGEAAILSAFARLMRGNSNAMLELVYATCGTAAGNLFSAMILRFIDVCVPTTETQREAYFDLTKTTNSYGVLYDMSLSLSIINNGHDPDEVADFLYSRLPAIIQRIVTIDAAVANVIENYVSLRVMTSWLWKTGEQKADLQVQASIDDLSDTVDEIITEIGSTEDEPLISSDIDDLSYTFDEEIIEIESTEDDPLVSSDIAAVTGIGNTSSSNKLQEKKQQ